MKRKLRVAALIPLLLILVACSNWEQKTYQTLAASKAAIDTAATQYNAGQLPQTTTVFNLISRARVAQTTAVDAMLEYEKLKIANSPTATLQAQQIAVTAAVTQVTLVIADIKALKGA